MPESLDSEPLELRVEGLNVETAFRFPPGGISYNALVSIMSTYTTIIGEFVMTASQLLPGSTGNAIHLHSGISVELEFMNVFETTKIKV